MKDFNRENAKSAPFRLEGMEIQKQKPDVFAPGVMVFGPSPALITTLTKASISSRELARSFLLSISPTVAEQ